jgi:hypothetical protein
MYISNQHSNMFTKTTAQTLICVLILFATSLHGQDLNFKLQSKLNFPGQTLANVFGYTQDGREYALVGGSKGLIVVDVTIPETPEVITQIPGPDNLWKEIKTYKSFCYVTTEGGGGLQVVDLSALPSDNLPYFNYTGDGAIFNALNTIHALHIDTTLGFLYAYGSNLFNGGAVVLVSSAAARIGLANHEAIAAAKAGIIGLVLSAAATYARQRIRFNAVAPGLVRTPLTRGLVSSEPAEKASVAMHPLGRLGEPEDVARAICFLLDPAQGWITGQVLGVDGGLADVKARPG